MRIELGALVAALGFSVSACASAPRHDAGANEVPMYSNAEWAQMNSGSSIPEIPADEVASNDVASSTTSFHNGSSGFVARDAFGDNIGGARFSFGGGSSAFGSSGGFTPTLGHATIFAGSSSFGGGSHFSGGGHASFGGGHSSGGHGGGHGGH